MRTTSAQPPCTQGRVRRPTSHGTKVLLGTTPVTRAWTRLVACGFLSVRLRLSPAPSERIVPTRNRSCTEETILYFSHAALLDLSPRAEALQVRWVGLFETGSFANQITRRP